jgi:hypothetical protein
VTGAASQNANGDEAAWQAWRAVRDSVDLQFAPVAPRPVPPPSQPPAWLNALGEALRSVFEPLGRLLGMSWPVLEKILLALTVLLVLFIAWRVAASWLARRRNRPAAAPEPEWAPDRAEALALLEDADRLAREGHFAEAVHLLLRRSVRHIAAARPAWLRPASTAREIATLSSLPDRARAAFGVIAARVERSRFARRSLDRGDWDAARSAYADFALADLRA